MRALALALALSAQTAWAGRSGNARQLHHAAVEANRNTDLTMEWRVPGQGRDTVTASLETAEINADKSVKRAVQLSDLYVVMAKAARRSAQGRERVKLTAKATRAGVQLRVTGAPSRGAAKAALADAQAAMDAARLRWMQDHRVMEVVPGALSYDHARIVAERADAIAPLAAALRAGTSSKREFVARALAFTQAIPYQKGRRGADAGFQHPLALVARNKGDCDGKSALFLALVRAELPSLPLAMVYVPGHALVGVGLPPKPGDRTFQHRGTEYVYAEPVGPAAHPLGSPAKANRRAGKRGVIRPVPR